jgi:hypothetical protein
VGGMSSWNMWIVEFRALSRRYLILIIMFTNFRRQPARKPATRKKQ